MLEKSKIKIVLVSVVSVIFIAGVCSMSGCSRENQTDAQAQRIAALNLPPDPGEAGNTDIPGIDVNKNKIRDDLEISILENPNTSTTTKAAFIQNAKALQEAMEDDQSSREKTFEILKKMSRSSECMRLVLDLPEKTIKDLKGQITNTELREKALENFGSNFGGILESTPDSELASTCDKYSL